MHISRNYITRRIYFNPMGGKKSTKYPNGPDISADEFPAVSGDLPLLSNTAVLDLMQQKLLTLVMLSTREAVLSSCAKGMTQQRIARLKEAWLQEWFDGLRDEQYKGTRYCTSGIA